MSAWYKTGTVNVSTGSQTVIGVGALFISNCRAGDAFLGPDGLWYEVLNVASDTSIGIFPAYKGAAVNNGTYMLAPMEGYVKESADRLRQIVDQFGDSLADLEGKTVVVSVAGVAADVVSNDVPVAGLKAALGFDTLQPKEAGKGLSTNDYTTPEKTKLAGVATGATANSTDATLINRANHTGTQLASTISNFAASALAVALAGLSVATSTAVVATDSILVAIGKLQAQASKLVPVTSNTDATPGRLLTVSSFGVGALVPRIEANTIDALRDSGRFYLTAANGAGSTPGGIGVGYLDSIVYAATYAIQWFYTSDDATTYRRVLANNVWSAWFKQDFGVGVTLGNALPGGNANQAVPSGKYFVQTVWTGSPFSGTDNKNRGYIEVSSWGQAGYQLQEFTPLFYASANPKMFRTNIGGAWGAWSPIPVGYLAARDSVTSGELLSVGHSGWNGGFAIVVGNGADCNTLLSAHMYALNGTYTNGPSFFSGNPFFLRVLVHGVGYEVQEAIGITNALKAVRRRVNNVWGEWIPDITGFNVTSDPALNSGGIVYAGSNANGSFVKFADGTAMCWAHNTTQITTSVAAGAGFQGSTSAGYTFPIAFVSTTPIQVIPRATYVSGPYQPWAIATAQSFTAVAVIPMSFANNVVATCGYFAIGRWK